MACTYNLYTYISVNLTKYFAIIKKFKPCPDQCGSVVWASSHKAKGHQLDSQSGHMLWLQVWAPVRAHAGGD